MDSSLVILTGEDVLASTPESTVSFWKTVNFMFKILDSLLNGLCDVLRKNSTYIAKRAGSFHLGKNLPKSGRNLIFTEITEALDRNLSLSGPVCPLFQFSLKGDPGKRILILPP